MRPVRTLLLLALCVSGALAGCFGASEDQPRLAVPTNEPPKLPPRNDLFDNSTQARKPMEVNTSDPGYIIEGAWHQGDMWYYETQSAPYRYRWTEVMEVHRREDGNVTYLVEERSGAIGNKPSTTLRVVVDGQNWTRVRADDGDMNRLEYTPPAPNLRFLRNGSFEYHELGTSRLGYTWTDRHVVNSVYAGNQPVGLSWGAVTAARIEHRDLILSHDGNERRVLLVRWMHRDYLNDVAFEIDNARYYLLTGVQIDGERHGTFPARTWAAGGP